MSAFGRAVGAALLGMAAAGCVLWRSGGPRAVPGTLMVNAPVDARWTETTREAAATPRQRQVLRGARPKTIVGEVVDVSCYLQLGKRGESHIPCGQQCIRHGQPIGVITDSGKLYLIIPEEHHPRRDGEIDIRERFAELVGKRINISGMATTYHASRALFVRSVPTER
ncbi:MAG: hypothetical protein HY737_03855 [Candidatus Omnitrophica bacterium]|nr:hypothetical protein [Candidatus Omnitrophota bacterium]